MSISRRRTELGLIILGAVITTSAYTLAALGRTASIPTNIVPFLGIILGLFVAAHIATRKLAPGADGLLLPLAALLNGLGYVMIARLESRTRVPRPGERAGGVDGDRHRRVHRHPRRRAPGARPAALPLHVPAHRHRRC